MPTYAIQVLEQSGCSLKADIIQTLMQHCYSHVAECDPVFSVSSTYLVVVNYQVMLTA